MAAVQALQLIGILFVLWLVVFQIVVPIIAGTRLFPIFGRRSKLEGELVELRDEQEIAELERKVELEKKNLNRLKSVRVADETKKGE